VLGVKSVILSSLQHFTTFVVPLNVWTFDRRIEINTLYGEILFHGSVLFMLTGARRKLLHKQLFCTFWHSEDGASWYIIIMKANYIHYFSNLFHKVLYMFRTGPLSIIRSISTLYTRNRYLSYWFCWRLLEWSGWKANRTNTTNIYCVYTVLWYSWWWTVNLSETCRVFC